MKKALSVILSVIMLVTAFPLVANANAHTTRTEALVLGSESMSSEQEGWSYDAATHTLVLSGVTINCSSAELDGNCITATEDLNIVLEGENYLYSRTQYTFDSSLCDTVKYSGDLNISGTGTLNIVEGNFSFYATSSSCDFVIDSGKVNITHDFKNPAINEQSNSLVIGSNNQNAVINAGELSCDVMFMAKEINGGKVNSYIISTKKDLTVNGGEVNAGMLFAHDLIINDGTLNVTGGIANVTVSSYLTDSHATGILVLNTFEMNGGNVSVFGEEEALATMPYDGDGNPTLSFNGGSFTAESDSIAICAFTKDGIDDAVGFSKNVEVSTPSPYSVNTLQTENDFSILVDGVPTYFKAKVTSIWDADVEEPTYDYDQTLMKVESNAAKKVVISERNFPNAINLDRDGGTWQECFDKQGADEIESGVYGKVAKGWCYETETSTLYLYNATIDARAEGGTCINSDSDLNIVIEGENNLLSNTVTDSGSPAYPVLCKGDLNISGSGTLNIYEGNISLRTYSDSSAGAKLVVDGGVINIIHDFKNADIDENSTQFVFANSGANTVINGGELNCDVMLFAKEINGGTVNSYGVASKTELTINGGVVNAGMLFALDMVINGGTVTASGGNIKVFAKDYLTESDSFGIGAVSTFEMNGGTVNACGSFFGLAAAVVDGGTCKFNNGNFTAEGGVFAIISTGSEDSEPTEFACSDNVRVETPSSYKTCTILVEGAFTNEMFGEGVAKMNITSIWDSSAEEPYINGDSFDTCTTNAAKKVEIKQYLDYSVEADVEAIDFGTHCYKSNKSHVPDAVTVTVTNVGNQPLYIHPWSYPSSSNAFLFTRRSDINESVSIKPGESVQYLVHPNDQLGIGDYSGYIEFATSAQHHNSPFVYRCQVPVTYVLKSHDYGEYVSNNDATYDADGTKTRTCADCGATQTVTDKGSKLLRNGWFDEEEGRRYYVDDVAQSGWQEIDGGWYLLTDDGYAREGWIRSVRYMYYTDENAVPVKNCWLKVDGNWYHFDVNGIMQTDWLKLSGKWYFLKTDGVMATGWIRSGGKWYYLKSNGAMATGWVKDSGKWYYLNTSGAMVTGWLKDGGKWYYLNSDGSMRTANLTYKGKVYKFNSSGVCLNP